MRLFISIVALVGAIFISPWIPFVSMIILSVRVRAWEVILIGLSIDFLYQPAGLAMPLFTIAGILLVWGFEPLRREFLAK